MVRCLDVLILSRRSVHVVVWVHDASDRRGCFHCVPWFDDRRTIPLELIDPIHEPGAPAGCIVIDPDA